MGAAGTGRTPATRQAVAFVLMATVLAGACGGSAQAAATPAAVRETAEYVVRQFGKEAAEEGAESLGRRIGALAQRCGDDALLAARKAGPRGLRLAEQAGDDAPRVVRLLARHGDEAAWVLSRPEGIRLFLRHGDDAAEAMMRHKGIAEELIAAYDRRAVEALRAVSEQNGRRLAMMAQEGTLAAGGRPADLLGVVGRYGDRGMDFVWRNRKALAAGAVLTAFLTEPEPFINGTRDLAKLAVEAMTQPVGQVGGELARDIGGRTNWTWVLSVLVLVVAGLVVLRGLRRPRAR